MRVRTLLAGAAALMLSAGAAMAWDTKELHFGVKEEALKWRSLLGCLGGESVPFADRPISDCPINEHELIANWTLNHLAPGNPWTIAKGNGRTLVDLNENWYRAGESEFEPSNATPLLLRHIPNPPHFAGLPDVSYTVHDWLNMNRYCPSRPDGNRLNKYCYNFAVFHGAGFNSSHFGSQATRSYQQLHALAVKFANDARKQREALNPVERELYADAIREAEMLALTYEGTAQHFLQDRWAMGHMWDRWGPPDFRPWVGDDVGLNLAVGAFTGIIHGSQSVTALPAPMSSPSFNLANIPKNKLADIAGFFVDAAVPLASLRTLYQSGDPVFDYPITPVLFRQGRHGPTFSGVGDYRYRELLTGSYSVVPPALSGAGSLQTLNVRAQRLGMLECAAGGFRQVISAFGANDGGYGIDRVRLTELGKGGPGKDCFESWATNESMKGALDFFWQSSMSLSGEAGAETSFDKALGGLARTAVAVVKSNEGVIDLSDVDPGLVVEPSPTGIFQLLSRGASGIFGTVEVNETDAGRRDRIAITRIGARIRYYGMSYPQGTDLSAGDALPPFVSLSTGKSYPVADYFESSAGLDALPLREAQGKDKATIKGMFNRAQPELLCGAEGLKILEQTRRSADPQKRALCRYIAGKMFAGSDARYLGNQAVTLAKLMDADGDVRPMCVAMGGDNFEIPAAFESKHPYQISPVLVPFSESNPDHKLMMGKWALTAQTVANWCDSAPEPDLIDDDELRNADVVAVIKSTTEKVRLTGQNFGAFRGVLRAGWDGNWTDIKDVTYWSEKEIEFRITDQIATLPFRDGDIRLSIEAANRGDRPADARTLPGRAILRQDFKRASVTNLEVRQNRKLLVEIDNSTPEPAAVVATADPFAIPKAVAEKADGAFLPIGVGETDIVLKFDEDVDPDWDQTRIALGSFTPTEARFSGPREWRGRFTLTAEQVKAARGKAQIVVKVLAKEGAPTDADPSTPGDQPEQFTVVIDTAPLLVAGVEAYFGRTPIYRAHWNTLDGIDKAATNLTLRKHETVVRRLDTDVRTFIPPQGAGRIDIMFNHVPTEASVTIGGTVYPLTGDGQKRSAKVDYATLRALGSRRVPLKISATDEVGKSLDGDPRTPALIDLDTYRVWTWFEDQRGGTAMNNGGSDTWHVLGTPPDLSLVVLLDASGSMEDNGRMVSAKTGIIDTLTRLDPKIDVEISLIVFSGCGSITASPFISDRKQVIEQVRQTEPGGGTPLAMAYDAARRAFASGADPASNKWNYLTLSDGEESCGGDTGAQLAGLNRVINQRVIASRAEPPAPAITLAQLSECKPESWSRSLVKTDSRSSTLPNLTLVRYSFREFALADGRCLTRLERKAYGVAYGRVTGNGKSRMRLQVNSSPSQTTRMMAVSDRGEARMAAVRHQAGVAKSRTVESPEDMQQLRALAVRYLGGSGQ